LFITCDLKLYIGVENILPLLQRGHLACTTAGHIGKFFSWLFMVQINLEYMKIPYLFEKTTGIFYFLKFRWFALLEK